MRRVMKYLLLFMIAMTVALGANATSVYATEENVRTGKAGTNGGFTWTFDQNTKTLTVTGEDSGLGSSDNETSYNPFLVIAQEAEIIILQNCKISGSMNGAFSNCVSLKSVEFRNTDTSKVTGMSCMFDNCIELNQLYMDGLDTSNVTDMSDMFYGCSSLKSLDLSSFNTSKVTDMDSMFRECSSLKSLDLSGFDTSKLEDMAGMFWDCSSLKSLDLSNLNTSTVTDMDVMFSGCSSLTNLNLSGFNTSKVTSMEYMFQDCSSLKSLDLSSFNTSKVKYMSGMFWGCSGLKSLDLSSFVTTNVTDMYAMFNECTSLTSLDLSSFNIAKVTDMDIMFDDCNSLKLIRTPKKMATSQKIDLPYAFKDTNCNIVQKITSALCSTDIYKDSLKIVAETKELTVGDTLQLALKLDGVKQNISENGNYKWSVASKEVVTVSNTGLVTAVGPGTTTITVTAKSAYGGSMIWEKVDITVIQKVSIEKQPTSQTVEVGESATFVVEAQGSELSYQWQYKRVGATEWTKSGMTGAKTNRITVQGTDGRNGYKYRCVITDGNGNKVTSKTVTLTVIPKLAITSQPANQTVEEGANAVFKVTATGNNLSYQWQFKAAGTDEWKASGLTGAKTASLTVGGEARRNGQQYRCVITDESGNKVTSNAATLTVTEVALTITSQPEDQSVEEGVNAVFKVSATGNNLSYQWQFKAAGTDEWKASGLTGAKTASLTVGGEARRNGQQYRCVITEVSGNKVTSNAATLTVESELAITAQPVNQSVAEGVNAVFTVTATGSNISYQWQYKNAGANKWFNSGMKGATTNSLTVQGTAARNGQQYRCIITEVSGNIVTSNVVTLTVEYELAITVQPVNQSVKEGSSAVFKVEASGNNLSYQWQYKNAGADKWFNSGMKGATTNSITVQGTAARNGQQYRCIITEVSGETVTSDAATLTVN